jgi:glucose-6-phosphate dehydrogenase assembly protein OpcA
VITTLTDTTASAIDKKMTEMRETFGANTGGRVMTLLIVTTGDDISTPLEAAVAASHEHPSRVIVVDADDDAPTGLDAEIRVGRDAGAGDVIILHARGSVMSSLDTLITPLLLSDVPVVTWWPEDAPSSPVHDVLGSISQRRITDAHSCHEPLGTLKRLRRGYTNGDTDLAWARLTRWRGLAASAYEVPPVAVPRAVTVTGDPEDPSVILMKAWLELAFDTTATIERSRTDVGPLESISFEREDGTIRLSRTDADTVVLALPGTHSGDQAVPMAERTLDELLAEELRRLDPDVVYGEVLAHAFAGIEDASTYAKRKPAPSDVVLPDAGAVAARAARDVATQVAEAIAARGEAHLVVTGGSVGTATALELPAAFTAAGVDSTAVHVWWGDERFVDPDSEERNDHGIEAGFLQAAGLDAEKIHRIPGNTSGMSLDEAAAWYGQELDRAGGDTPFHTRGQAFFDVLLLGVGPDGHVASLFPEHPAQRQDTATAIGVTDSPKPPSERVSLTWPVLNSARHVGLLVAGSEKAAAVARGHGAIDPWHTPASSVRGLESTTWYLDEAAAGDLAAG